MNYPRALWHGWQSRSTDDERSLPFIRAPALPFVRFDALQSPLGRLFPVGCLGPRITRIGAGGGHATSCGWTGRLVNSVAASEAHLSGSRADGDGQGQRARPWSRSHHSYRPCQRLSIAAPGSAAAQVISAKSTFSSSETPKCPCPSDTLAPGRPGTLATSWC